MAVKYFDIFGVSFSLIPAVFYEHFQGKTDLYKENSVCDHMLGKIDVITSVSAFENWLPAN